MPNYDTQCNVCGYREDDQLQPINHKPEPCPSACGGVMERVWTSKASGVIPDDIPGGVEVRHGICNPDGTPRKFYSKSEMDRAAKKAGMVNYVTHVPAQGSDKSKHTSLWVAPPVISEEERVRNWRETEMQDFGKLPAEMPVTSKNYGGRSRTHEIIAELGSKIST